MEDKFRIDYQIQSDIKEALEIAKWYCKENIPKVDGWSRQGLEAHLETIEELINNIGNSFVVGNYD